MVLELRFPRGAMNSTGKRQPRPELLSAERAVAPPRTGLPPCPRRAAVPAHGAPVQTCGGAPLGPWAHDLQKRDDHLLARGVSAERNRRTRCTRCAGTHAPRTGPEGWPRPENGPDAGHHHCPGGPASGPGPSDARGQPHRHRPAGDRLVVPCQPRQPSAHTTGPGRPTATASRSITGSTRSRYWLLDCTDPVTGIGLPDGFRTSTSASW